jgi:hypothetical protein
MTTATIPEASREVLAAVAAAQLTPAQGRAIRDLTADTVYRSLMPILRAVLAPDPDVDNRRARLEAAFEEVADFLAPTEPVR